MKDDVNEFLDSKKVVEIIKKFEKKTWPKFCDGDNIEEFVEHITKSITSELNVFSNLLLRLKPEIFPFGIFRVRSVNSFSNIGLFSEHSYPPINIVKLGRCNFPQYPVFYGSNDPITALAEVVRENDFKDQKFCISSWELIPSEKEFLFESFLNAKLHPKNQFDILAKSLIERMNEPFKGQLSIEKQKGVKEFLKYIDQQFINDNNYSISASLAHRRLYGNHNLCTDILMYPSVQTNKIGVNFAIHPNFVYNHLRIKRVHIVEIKNYKKEIGEFSISFYKYGEIIKNKIIWKNISPSDKNYKKAFEDEFRNYVDKNYKYKFEQI